MSERAKPMCGDSTWANGGLSSQLFRSIGRVSIAGILLALSSTIARAGTDGQAAQHADPALLCDAAAVRASHESGVPLYVLRAISLTETGRQSNGALRPWPWTVNMEGKGDWFSTWEQALAHAEANYNRGARSFDVGCFQLNYRWHGDAFRSIEEMFDPLANARYAAGFLAELHAELGDWSAAAGAYHSRTPEYAKRYRARFDTILATLDGGALPTPSPMTPLAEIAAADVVDRSARINSFPLLQASAGPTSLGSLVPLDSGPSVSFFGSTSAGPEDAL